MKLKLFLLGLLPCCIFLNANHHWHQSRTINVVNNGQISISVNGIEMQPHTDQMVQLSENQLSIAAPAMPGMHEIITLSPEEQMIIIGGFFDPTKNMYFIRTNRSNKLPTDIVPIQNRIDPIPQAF